MASNPFQVLMGVLAGCIAKRDFLTFKKYLEKLLENHGLKGINCTYTVDGMSVSFLSHVCFAMGNSQDEKERTVLIQFIRLLLKKKINPNLPANGFFPLEIACTYKLEEVVQVLVDDDRTDVNRKDAKGRSCLAFTAFANHTNILKILLTRNDIAVNCGSIISPLILTINANNIDLSRALLEKKANPFLLVSNLTAYDTLIRADSKVYDQLIDDFHLYIDKNGFTINFPQLEQSIIFSIEQKKIESLDFLLRIFNKKKGDINARFVKNGITCLYLAVGLEFSGGVKLLLEYGASPDQRCSDGNPNVVPTPFMLAIKNKSNALSYMMLPKVKELNQFYRTEKAIVTPLQFALMLNPDPSLLEAMLKAGADPNIEKSAQCNCLFIIYKMNLNLLDLFFKYGAKASSLAKRYFLRDIYGLANANEALSVDEIKNKLQGLIEELSLFRSSIFEETFRVFEILSYINSLSVFELKQFKIDLDALKNIYSFACYTGLENQIDKLQQIISNHPLFPKENAPIDTTQLKNSARSYLKEIRKFTDDDIEALDTCADEIKKNPAMTHAIGTISTWGGALISKAHFDVIKPIRKTINGYLYLAVDTMLEAHGKIASRQKIESDLNMLSKREPVADGVSLRHLTTGVSRTLIINNREYKNCPAVFEYRTAGKARVICYHVPDDQKKGIYLSIGAEYLPEGLHDHNDEKSFASSTKPIKIIYTRQALNPGNANDSSKSESSEKSQVPATTVGIGNQSTQASMLPLIHQAAANGNIDLIKKLISEINLPSPTTKATPIFNAVKEGQLEAVKFLLQKGAKINAQTRSGNTPLDICTLHTKKNKEEILKLLKEQGAKTKLELENETIQIAEVDENTEFSQKLLRG